MPTRTKVRIPQPFQICERLPDPDSDIRADRIWFLQMCDITHAEGDPYSRYWRDIAGPFTERNLAVRAWERIVARETLNRDISEPGEDRATGPRPCLACGTLTTARCASCGAVICRTESCEHSHVSINHTAINADLPNL